MNDLNKVTELLNSLKKKDYDTAKKSLENLLRERFDNRIEKSKSKEL